MAFRAWCYEVRVLQRWLHQHPDARRLPPVFTELLQQYRTRDTQPSLSRLFALPATVFRSRRYLPELKLIVFNLPSQDDDALLQSGMTDAG